MCYAMQSCCPTFDSGGTVLCAYRKVGSRQAGARRVGEVNDRRDEALHQRHSAVCRHQRQPEY